MEALQPYGAPPAALPLHCAAGHGYKEVARALLAASPGAAEQRDQRGRLPLHWAAAGGHGGVAEALLAAFPGAVAQRDNDGKVPADLAAEAGVEGALLTMMLPSQVAPAGRGADAVAAPLSVAPAGRRPPEGQDGPLNRVTVAYKEIATVAALLAGFTFGVFAMGLDLEFPCDAWRYGFMMSCCTVVCLDLFSTFVLTLQVYQTARVQEHYGTDAADRFMKHTAGLRKAAVWSFLVSAPVFLLLLLIAAVAMLPDGDPGIAIPLVLTPLAAAGIGYAIWQYRKQYLSIVAAPKAPDAAAEVPPDADVEAGQVSDRSGSPVASTLGATAGRESPGLLYSAEQRAARPSSGALGSNTQARGI